ncbi:splicing factor 3B subunit 2 [Spatholobus suberectus]|nr:splicing factor 3B subunit 2 [Spatholobus suberectus]
MARLVLRLDKIVALYDSLFCQGLPLWLHEPAIDARTIVEAIHGGRAQLIHLGDLKEKEEEEEMEEEELEAVMWLTLAPRTSQELKRVDLLRGQKSDKVDVTLFPEELDAMENVLPAKYEEAREKEKL